ncbi:MAG: DUF1207 domain-containing protein [Gemmatimonadota bacterium]|nr:DUF1207 domain-containing protein [Gemmatimonadota bacterium]MDH3423862.1 DUF1207 domain-containing protein [Gemmatimonadota bacterium]
MRRSKGRAHAVGGTINTVLLVGLFAAGVSRDASAQESFLNRCGAAVHDDEGSGWISVPQGQIFCPLAADPKAERSFVSYLRGDFATIADRPPDVASNIAAVGFGDSFALFRWAARRHGNGVQFDVAGAVFSQFNLDRPSFDLINADYLVGLPVTARFSGFSIRVRPYHQSSHLGDEFLLNRQPERINLSFESLEVILSQEIGLVRIYGGGESFFRKEPDDLARRLVHAGAELRPVLFGAGRALAAVDYKLVDDGSWSYAWNVRAGIELARVPSPGHPPRVVSIVADYYNGTAPYGQFYRDDIRYVGVGINLSH